jgi:hypothetical protein
MVSVIVLITPLLLLVLSAASSQKLSSGNIPRNCCGPNHNVGKVLVVGGVSSVGLSCVLFWPTDGTVSKPGGGGGCSAAAADDDDAAASSAAVVVGVGSLASGLADPAP